MTKAHFFPSFEKFMQLEIGISDKGHNFDEKFNGNSTGFLLQEQFQHFINSIRIDILVLWMVFIVITENWKGHIDRIYITLQSF